MPVEQVPGCGHVTQHHIDAFVIVLACSQGCSTFFFLLFGAVFSLEFEVGLVYCLGQYIFSDSVVGGRREDEGTAETAAVGIA